ncbi:MAG TPA: cytochrome P450 [Actinocrinis sp.]|nr:cytochrome P450 [Actinocrinis sp.]
MTTGASMSGVAAVVQSDSELEAQLRTSRAALRSIGSLGDHYATVLLGQDDPYPVYEKLRRRGPLQQSRLGTWIITGRSLADEVLRDRRFGRRTTQGEWPAGYSDFDNSFLAMDPPDHGRLRRLAMPLFSPRAVGRLRAEVERACTDLLDKVGGDGSFDVMTDFAAQVPLTVIAAVFGIPEQWRERFSRLAEKVALVLAGVAQPAEVHAMREGVAGMNELFRDIIELRRREPGEDLVSRLIGDVDGELLTADELVAMCGMLSLAGTETTVHLIGNGVLAMLDAPEQWDLLCGDVDLAAGAVEETLRFDASVQIQSRYAHSDIELAGKRVKKDAQLVMLTGACNRDPEVWADPGVFRLGRRDEAEHISFSSGIHYCVGAPLARLEGEVALRMLAERFPRLRRDGEVVRRVSPFIRGLRSLPVRGD